MHPKDYALILFVAAIVAALAGVGAIQKRLPWWKDAFQVAAVVMAVSMLVGYFSPAKPRSESDIAQGQTAAIAEAKRRATVDAMVACQYAIQAQLTYPSSYSGTMFSDLNRQIETTQGWEIYKAFEAKNGFGGSLPHVGHCSVGRDGTIRTVEIARS